MTVEEAMKLPSFAKAAVIAGEGNTGTADITGIMVLEALDIENWAHAGEIILSSYYALHSLSEQEIHDFIQKRADIRIAALIIKLERLLKEIPSELIYYCDYYQIPLIEISNDTSYEMLILEILRPIINANAAALNRYYQVHQKLSRLMLSEPTVHKLLQELMKMLQCDVSLAIEGNPDIYGTSHAFNHFKILAREPLPLSDQQIFQRYACTVSYESDDYVKTHICTAALIPGSEQNAATLYLHTEPETLDNDFFPVIENFMFFLQTELLKQGAIRRNLYLQTNEFVYNLLEQKYPDKEYCQKVLRHLHLTHYDYYQVITLRSFMKENPEPDASFESSLSYRFFHMFRDEFHKYCPHFSYGERESQLILICNMPERDKEITSGILREIMDVISQRFSGQRLRYHAALSSVKKRFELPNAYRETLDILKILNYKNDMQDICSYGEFGIYRLFLRADVLENPESMIPAGLLSFHEQHPELSQTLRCYLAHNQSIAKTAKAMFVHPKTVSYRISRIRELLDFDLENNESVMEMQIAYHALDLRKREEHP